MKSTVKRFCRKFPSCFFLKLKKWVTFLLVIRYVWMKEKKHGSRGGPLRNKVISYYIWCQRSHNVLCGIREDLFPGIGLRVSCSRRIRRRSTMNGELEGPSKNWIHIYGREDFHFGKASRLFLNIHCETGTLHFHAHHSFHFEMNSWLSADILILIIQEKKIITVLNMRKG